MEATVKKSDASKYTGAELIGHFLSQMVRSQAASTSSVGIPLELACTVFSIKKRTNRNIDKFGISNIEVGLDFLAEFVILH